MMKLPSTKPYLIRAIYTWCNECGYTPLLSVKGDAGIGLPKDKFNDNGEIVFNIHDSAVHNLIIGDDIISFSARFGGVAKEIQFSTEMVNGIFAKEVNQGIAFPKISLNEDSLKIEPESDENDQSLKSNITKQGKKRKTNLRIVK